MYTKVSLSVYTEASLSVYTARINDMRELELILLFTGYHGKRSVPVIVDLHLQGVSYRKIRMCWLL